MSTHNLCFCSERRTKYYVDTPLLAGAMNHFILTNEEGFQKIGLIFNLWANPADNEIDDIFILFLEIALDISCILSP